MKKSKQLIVYAIYVVVLIAYVIGITALYEKLSFIYFLNPMASLAIGLFEAFLFGMLLAVPHLIQLKFNKEGRYCYNLAQALIIGIPILLIGIGITIYSRSDISLTAILSYNTGIDKFCLLASGFIAIASIDKKVKNT